jgi:dihydrofolate reductase
MPDRTKEVPMRKVVVTEFMSLDGVIEDPGGAEGFEHGGWTIPYWDDDIGKFKFDELFASDALLLGRVTYQGFAAAWPSQTDEAGFADRMNGLPKYVVSTTLDTVEWNNSRLIKENVADEVARLKQQPGQDILVAGSAKLIRTLIDHDLVDEYRLLVYPVVLGSGKRLYGDRGKTDLKLVETKPFGSGVVLLTYQAPRNGAEG